MVPEICKRKVCNVPVSSAAPPCSLDVVHFKEPGLCVVQCHCDAGTEALWHYACRLRASDSNYIIRMTCRELLIAIWSRSSDERS